MAGFLEDIGEFFTGGKGKEALQSGQDLATQRAAEAQALGTQRAAEARALGQSVATQQAGIAGQQQNLADLATQQAAGYDRGAQQSMGGNAAEYMARANAAAMPQAAQAANDASIQGARNALMAARTAGMNRGASAVQAGQQATQGYTQNLNEGLQQARNQYQSATQQFANQGNALANRGMSYQEAGQRARQFGYGAQNAGQQQAYDATHAGQQEAYGAKKTANEQAAAAAKQSAGGGGGGISGILSGIGNFLSDENSKQNITASTAQDTGEAEKTGKDVGSAMTSGIGKMGDLIAKIAMTASDRGLKQGIVDSRLLDKVKGGGAVLTPDLDQLIDKVKPVDFNYKPESGEDPTLNRKGILAQDLEKTGMRDNVKDTPQGKMVDAGQQTLSNTNLIVQLAQELYDLKSQLRSKNA